MKQILFFFEPVGQRTVHHGVRYIPGINYINDEPVAIVFSVDKDLRLTNPFFDWAEKEIQGWLDTNDVNPVTYRTIGFIIQKQARLLCRR